MRACLSQPMLADWTVKFFTGSLLMKTRVGLVLSFLALEGWHPLEKMKNPTFLSYFLVEMKPDEMQASDEDQRRKDALAKIEMNRLKMKKIR